MTRQQEGPEALWCPSGATGNDILGFGDADGTQVSVVGGKGAHLAQLSRIDGVRVPAWFCVATAAYRRIVADVPSISGLLGALAAIEPGGHARARELSAAIRQEIEGVGVPDDLAAAIAAAVDRLGEGSAYAVRSSATAEDLPSASFAGQHDTYLNVMELPDILRCVSRCWASLFSDRAVSYRMRNGVDHRRVDMAVVVQQMVLPRASGVLFTADPATGNRNVAALEATFGLGQALVSGTVNADVHRVRYDRIIERAVADKDLVTTASPDGGTRAVPLEPARRSESVLTDQQILELVALGRRIASDLGCPQDVEWCLDDDGVQVVQSRPITTLFPLPDDTESGNRVYVSVGHQQMMTDPMTPLGLSIWQLTSPAPMRTAGGRLFVDVTGPLSSPATRAATLETLGRSDPLIRDALETVLERKDFIPAAADGGPDLPRGLSRPEPIETDPAIVADMIERHRASVAELPRKIQTETGPALFTLILEDLEALRTRLFDPRSHQVLMAAFEATWWLNDKLAEWLDERNAADDLAVAAPNNVTAEMGLALLDVADAVRPHAAVVAYLQEGHVDDFLDGLGDVEGGAQAREAINSYLAAYGMRCVGEVDIARPRWRERPSALVPMILSNVENFEPGERHRRIEQGRQQARHKEQELLTRLRALPGGADRAEQTKRMIDRLRTFIGYREYPKYHMVSRYFIYKQALLAEAEPLVQAGVLPAVDDIYFLRFHELHDVVRNGYVDRALIRQRRQEFRFHNELTPPRVLTSEGEALSGAYRRDDAPPGALVGLAVSGGAIEGRARVVLDMADADLQPGDILVTPHADPSWSPLFLSIAGLVTEVGGLMTHGAVIAREYGLAAVVGVDHATQRILDGQRIRVDGTRGLVEIVADRTEHRS